MINPTHMAQVQPDRPTVSTHHLTSRAKGRRTAKAEPTRTAKTLQSFIVLADILTTRLAMPSLHHLLIGRLRVTVRTQTQVIMIIAPMRSIGELCHRHHLPFYRQPTDIRGVCDLFFIESSQRLCGGRRAADGEPRRRRRCAPTAPIHPTAPLHHPPATKEPLRGHEKLTQAHETRESDERAAAVWTPFC